MTRPKSVTLGPKTIVPCGHKRSQRSLKDHIFVRMILERNAYVARICIQNHDQASSGVYLVQIK